MNWLAHLLLSEPTPAFRLGGILPDFVSAAVLVDLPMEFQLGIQRHRQIDAFTDAHAIFRRSVQRFDPPFRRFGGILVDIFYDHFLARDWACFSDTSLPDFATEVYASFEIHRTDIPFDAYSRLQKMQEHNWLCSYANMDGIAETLRRIGTRFRRPFDLAPSISILEQHYKLFHADFAAFFPELVGHFLTNSAHPARGS